MQQVVVNKKNKLKWTREREMNLNPLAVLIYFCSNVVNLRLMKKIRLLSK